MKREHTDVYHPPAVCCPPEPGPEHPIVILGGFLSFSLLYVEMRDVLAQITGQPVWIVDTQSLDWLPSIVPPGWVHLLRKLDHTVRQAASRSTTVKITLIGHSAGWVLARLYLSPRPFLGHAFRGLDYIDHLITLGSPHYNQRLSVHGGRMSRWIEKRYPGAFFAPCVEYTAVAGKLVRGDRQELVPRPDRVFRLQSRRVLAAEEQSVLDRDSGLRREKLEGRESARGEHTGHEVVLEDLKRDDLVLPEHRLTEDRPRSLVREIGVGREAAGVRTRVVDEHPLLRAPYVVQDRDR